MSKKNKKDKTVLSFLMAWGSVCAVLLVPGIIVAFLISGTAQKNIKNNTYSGIQNILETNTNQVEAKLNAVEDASVELMVSLVQNSAVMDTEYTGTTAERYMTVQDMFRTYSNLVNTTYNVDGFSHFYLYYPQNSLVLVSGISYFENIPPNALDCHEVAEGVWKIATPYKHVISNPSTRAFYSERDLVYNYHIEDNSNNKLILTSCLKEEYVNKILQEDFQISPEKVIILDEQGIPVSSNDKKELGSTNVFYQNIITQIKATPEHECTEIEVDGQKYLLNWKYSDMNHWYYLTFTNVEALLLDTNVAYFLIRIVLPCMLCFALLLTWLYRKQNQKQIASLRHSLRKFGEELEQAESVNEVPEIPTVLWDYEFVVEEFANLVQKTHQLAERAAEEKNMQKMATIQMLQSEINPHMLYNSLESAYSIAVINGQEEVASLIMALSKFFRIALSGGKRAVTFKEAFELANQYIIVQNIRVANKIHFTYNIDDSLWNMVVPKFLFQPIVENSIIHGFKNKREDWNIKIDTYRKDGGWIISVEDNGIGMNELTLEALKHKINDFVFEDTTKHKGYALRNLNYQIKLEYGEASGLEIHSRYGEGTKSIIVLNEKERKKTDV